jgi:uncharacterized protein YdbL (DUF1318 family)
MPARISNQAPPFHHQTTISVFQNTAGRVGHHQNGYSLRFQGFHSLETLVLETDIANCQRLIDYQNFRINTGCKARLESRAKLVSFFQEW